MNTLREKPYLSIITISRNDDYGVGALRRMQVTLNARLEQLEKYNIESEIIIVDWNPPPEKPLLKDVLLWPDTTQYCTVRVIIIPASVHKRFKHSDKIPMNGVVALNCGIRRARGEFILPGHIDLLYSDELMSFISSKALRKEERYRIARCDVDRNVVQFDTLEKQLEFCRNNIIRIKAHNSQPKRQFSLFRTDLPNLFTSASGDFQLISRSYWYLLRGYFEYGIVGAWVDSILSYASYAAGVKETILKPPMRLYHIDHENKFNESIVTESLPFENQVSLSFMPTWFNNKIMRIYRKLLKLMGYKMKSSVKGVPILEYSDYKKMCSEMISGKRTYVLNDKNWGLGNESFDEFIISIADWDQGYEKN